jgi:hypothetical protein
LKLQAFSILIRDAKAYIGSLFSHL